MTMRTMTNQPRTRARAVAHSSGRLLKNAVSVNLSGRAFAHVRLAWLILALTFAATACASVAKSQKRNALESSQYAFSSAIRWGDFEGAWNLIDPDYREKHPMSDIDFSRYQQVQVSGYRDLGSQTAADGTEMREVQIDLINRHNLSQRSLRYTEIWRYDEAAKAWWNTAGLPDFWQGQ